MTVYQNRDEERHHHVTSNIIIIQAMPKIHSKEFQITQIKSKSMCTIIKMD